MTSLLLSRVQFVALWLVLLAGGVGGTSVRAQENVVVNASDNGATATVTQSTWKGAPEDMIDRDPSTVWQVEGNPNDIIAIFELADTATVKKDSIDIGGTGGGRSVSEYEIYTRYQSSDPWSLATTVDASVNEDDNGGTEGHTFAEPIEGTQFRLVITKHNAPSGCGTACDVPIAEYQLIGSFGATAAADTLYVDADAGGANDGSSWEDAYVHLQDAFDRALRDSAVTHEIWVAEGTYYPDRDEVDHDGDGATEHTEGSRTESFTVVNDNVVLYGGFSGGESVRSERDPSTHEVVLSGDIGAVSDTSDNSYNVLYLDGTTGPDITKNTVLDGVTVEKGVARGDFPNGDGGGLFCDAGGSGNRCAPVIENVVFRKNVAVFGGAIFNNGTDIDAEKTATAKTSAVRSDGKQLHIERGTMEENPSSKAASSNGAHPELRGVVFRDNKADGSGGAMYNWGDQGAAGPQISNSKFVGNVAESWGGAIMTDGSPGQANPVIQNTTFDQNQAQTGGALLLFAGIGGTVRPEVRGAVFSQNEAEYGGAVQVFSDSTDTNGNASEARPLFRDVTFSQNQATGATDDSGNPASDGGALRTWAIDEAVAEPTVVNGVFTGNTAARDGGALHNVVASDVNGGVVQPTITNGTFAGNAADKNGGAVHNLGGDSGSASPVLTNVILWGNQGNADGDDIGGDNEMFSANSSAQPTIRYSIVEGGAAAIEDFGDASTTYDESNLDQNPQFAAVNGGAGEDGVFGTDDDDLRLQGPGSPNGASPAIDAGDNAALDLNDDGAADVSQDRADLNRRIDVDDVSDTGNGSSPIVDIGAYESDGSPLREEETLAAPATLRVGGTPDGIQLDWDSVNALDLQKYRIYRDTQPIDSTAGPSSYAAYDSTAAGDTTFTDTDVTDGTTYYYRVTAVNSVGTESDFSEEGSATPQSLETIYVDADATGAEDGTSWADAFTSLQDALAAATSGTEIWVAEGVYYPDEGAGIPDGKQDTSFVVDKNIQIYGGFEGNETSRNEQGSFSPRTILSGDVDQDDSRTDTGLSVEISGNNSHHVLFLNGADGTPLTRETVLSGLWVTGGQADGPDFFSSAGGGLYCYAGGEASVTELACNPRIETTVFFTNRADLGGAVFNDGAFDGESSPRMELTFFFNNLADNTGGYEEIPSRGGALYNNGPNGGASNPVLVDVSFSNNRSVLDGGAVYNYGVEGTSGPFLVNTTFFGNEAGESGGGVYSRAAPGDQAPLVVNSTFVGNVASGIGGGFVTMGGDNSADPTRIVNTTIAGNRAGGISGGGAAQVGDQVAIVNSILWGNAADGGTDEISTTSGASLTIESSLIDGGWSGSGTGNLKADPEFVLFQNPEDPPPETAFLQLHESSPALDAGDEGALPRDLPDVDGDGDTSERLPVDRQGESRVQGSGVDLGAYEGGEPHQYPEKIQVDVSRTFGDATEKENYRLLGAPGEIDVNLRTAFSGTSPEDWRAFREEGGTTGEASSLLEANGSDALSPGIGYWGLAREGWAIDRSVSSVQLRSGAEYRIGLHEGWNVISNPFATDISWSFIQEENEINAGLWRWNGRWVETETLTDGTEGEAFYFRNEAGLDSLDIPHEPILLQEDAQASSARWASLRSRIQSKSGSPERFESTLKDSSATEAPDQTLVLRARRDECIRAAVRVGLDEGASAGLDQHDRFAPPGRFQSVAMRLDPDSVESPLAADVRPSGTEDGARFDIVLEAPAGKPVTLEPDSLTSFSDQRVVLVSQATATQYDLRRRNEITVTPSSDSTRWTLLIGTRDYVSKQKQLLTPQTVQLRGNYPNPVRRATTIEYALPDAQNVHLAVYDVLGRRVQVLVDGEQSAGIHTVRWQGRARGGERVASGVYFVRLRTDQQTKTRKMVVVR